MALGERIKKIRKEAGMTQSEFGNKLGLVKSTVSLYENNHSTPNDDIKLKICEYFDISMDYLLGLSNVQKKDREDLYIPDELKGIGVAFHKGEEGLTQDEIDKITEYVQFIRSQRKWFEGKYLRIN